MLVGNRRETMTDTEAGVVKKDEAAGAESILTKEEYDKKGFDRLSCDLGSAIRRTKRVLKASGKKRITRK